MTLPGPPDQAARRRIATDLAATLFVEAGAGAGKTQALSNRIVELVRAGVPIESIAAITFTEKAAADLRRRIRSALAASHDLLALAALDALDRAPIGTLHAFARRLLHEAPIAAGLPPAFGVLDEVGSDIAFDERWRRFRDDLLADDAAGRLVLFAETTRLRLDGLRDIARAFGENWDLVAERVDLTAPLPPPADHTLLVRRARVLGERATPDDDKLSGVVAHLAAWADALASADEFHAIELLADHGLNKSFGRVGNKQHWRAYGGDAALAELRDDLDRFRDVVEAEFAAVKSRWRDAIGAVLGRFTLDAAQERRRLGELEFHDLLVLARDLLRHHSDVRAGLHQRYQRLLLDEFQDTDPIQLELAVRLAADPAVDGATDWRDMRPLAGRLFFVGDPKQSIYRFRRADIAQYLAARAQVGADGELLTTNFRSAPEVLELVNHLFCRLITARDGMQPEFVALHSYRPAAGGSARFVGVDVHDDRPRADELRRREAADVAGAVAAAVTERWPVGSTGRACRYGDIAILLPSRTPLPMLQDALIEAGIPFQAENSSLVYATAEIRSLLMAVRAIDDPSDELATYTTLRSPLYGCSDRALYDWRRRGGWWRIDRPLPDRDGPDDPVHDAMTSLAAFAQRRHLLTPSEVLDELVTERRVFELALATPAARDTWRRVRFVVDQARAWSDAGGWGLRHYLDWTRRLGDDGRYVAEAVLPETDLDAVRIMTIHAAKGLEFPVVIVAGLTTRVGGARVGQRVVWPPGTWDLRSGDRHEAFQPVDEQLGHHERVRLLYVACTRAEDHLVVSIHRSGSADPERLQSASSAELLASVAHDAPTAEPAPAPDAAPIAAAASDVQLEWADDTAWSAERDRALARAARPVVLGATAIAQARPVGDDPAVDKDGVDLELPAWQRGRYGSAVGRAVHGVLQTVDLATSAGLPALAAAQAVAEGLVGRERLIERLARSALGAPIVQAAATLPHWRELYVAAPAGTQVIEGYVDLLVRDTSGLVLVDYKTDYIRDDDTLTAKVARYGRQLAAYALALERVLGEPVVDARLVLCGGDAVRELPVPRWSEVLESLRAELGATDAPDTAPRG